jgi:hypothetical protein
MAGLIGSPSIRYILAKFSLSDDGMLRNARLEQVRQGQADYKAKQAVSGKAGAEKRWKKCQNDSDPNGEPIATPMAERWPEDSSPSPSPSPTPEIQTKIQPPFTPQGGKEVEEIKTRIGSWFSRRASTIWSDKETKALKAVIALQTPPEDIDALEIRYKSGNQYLRRDIITLLNNWNTEIDRAKQPTAQLSLTHGQPSDAIARRNSLLGDDVAEQQAEAARISRAKDEAAMRRFEATGLTPWD